MIRQGRPQPLFGVRREGVLMAPGSARYVHARSSTSLRISALGGQDVSGRSGVGAGWRGRDARKQYKGCTAIGAFACGQRGGALFRGRLGRGFVMVNVRRARGIADMDNAQPPGGPAGFDQRRTAAAHLPASDEHELPPHERPHPDREAGQLGADLGAGHGANADARRLQA